MDDGLLNLLNYLRKLNSKNWDLFKQLKGIYFFHLKLFVPSFFVALIFGSFGYLNDGVYSLGAFGTAYVMIALLFHYFIYEMSFKKEYYFYYNLGLSKITLWISTIIISVLLKLILLFI